MKCRSQQQILNWHFLPRSCGPEDVSVMVLRACPALTIFRVAHASGLYTGSTWFNAVLGYAATGSVLLFFCRRSSSQVLPHMTSQVYMSQTLQLALCSSMRPGCGMVLSGGNGRLDLTAVHGHLCCVTHQHYWQTLPTDAQRRTRPDQPLKKC